MSGIMNTVSEGAKKVGDTLSGSSHEAQAKGYEAGAEAGKKRAENDSSVGGTLEGAKDYVTGKGNQASEKTKQQVDEQKSDSRNI